MKRTDHETGQPAQVCFQGERGCQWSPDGDLLRVGNDPVCRKAHRRRSGEVVSWAIPTRVWVIAVLLLLGVAFRFGPFVALRFLVPLSIGILAVTYGFRYGRQKQWW